MSDVRTFLIEPFDIMLHAAEEGVQSLQARFSTWLRTLNSPARFACWQMPATLDETLVEVQSARRLSEAGLVQALEKHGVGRPSTYAGMVGVIKSKGYVTLKQKRRVPTDTGMKLCDFLVERFPQGLT